MDWQLWGRELVQHAADGIKPLLASWEKSTHPAQVRLRAYLDDLRSKLLPLPPSGPLYLHLDVDVEEPNRLLRHYDLENYLTPLFGLRMLPAARFVLVTARKFVGGGSRVTVGTAKPMPANDDSDWTHFAVNAGQGASHHAWKERIRAGLAQSCTRPLPPGPVAVRLAWQCSERRNWCSLWKPTGDAMGPVLGTPNVERPFQLNDDRIVELEFHRLLNNELGHNVFVGMWWRKA